jgi:MYXO-CTERM domain-containing protein
VIWALRRGARGPTPAVIDLAIATLAVLLIASGALRVAAVGSEHAHRSTRRGSLFKPSRRPARPADAPAPNLVRRKRLWRSHSSGPRHEGKVRVLPDGGRRRPVRRPVSLPPGLAPFATNIVGGPYLVHVGGGARVVGRTSKGELVLKRTTDGFQPVNVDVRGQLSAPVVLGRITTAASGALLLALALAAAVRRRRRHSAARPTPRPTDARPAVKHS